MKLPGGQYGAILADPPWNFLTWSDKGKGRSADKHYDTMSFADIAKLPVAESGLDDCVLFLWVTDPMLQKGMELIERWGFKYKTVGFTWVKQNRKSPGLFTGMGYWSRSNPEMCLLATKGKPKRLNADVPQIITAPRREHSRKPDEIHDRIKRLVAGPYLELFARTKTKGWDVWGNETDRF